MKLFNYTYNNCINKLNEIESYKYNWDGNNSQPISINVINRVKNILYGLHIFPLIIPTNTNSIQLKFEYEDEYINDYLEFNVYEDNITMFNKKIHSGLKTTYWKEHLTENDIIRLIFKWRSDISMMIYENIKNI